jgi:hypothetical protein
VATYDARVEANKKNALLSTGPRTPEGKAISRANSYKHGLTGDGIVLPHEDAAELARRVEAMQVEMAPRNELARNLVIRVALATMRLERCALHEAKMTDYRMRHAHEQFDDARLAEVEKAISWIAAEPATHVRRLQSSLEGIGTLIEKFEGLKKDLLRPHGVIWEYRHCELIHHLMGLRRGDTPYTRARCLGEAIYGTTDHLNHDDAPGLAKNERKLWAADRLVELIDAEVARLSALREAIDVEAVALDRADAPFRAMFEPSKDAILARKYEAAVERSLYRALQEFREAQKIPTQVDSEQNFELNQIDLLASSFPESVAEEDGSADPDASPVEAVESALIGGDETVEPAIRRRDRPKLGRSKRR